MSRDDRMCFERIIALLLTNTIKTKTVNGNIHQDLIWGTNWSSYINNNNKYKSMYKVWVTRKDIFIFSRYLFRQIVK